MIVFTRFSVDIKGRVSVKNTRPYQLLSKLNVVSGVCRMILVPQYHVIVFPSGDNSMWVNWLEPDRLIRSPGLRLCMFITDLDWRMVINQYRDSCNTGEIKEENNRIRKLHVLPPKSQILTNLDRLFSPPG